MAVLLSGTTIGGHVAVHANNISTYALTSIPSNVITTSGGQTIAGITYFSNGESLNLYGIRGRFTNEYIHLYEKVGIGHPGGWGQGEANTPTQGLSIYGGINIAYARDNGATINTYTRINKNWGGGDYSAEAFTIRGTYPSITLRSTQHNSKWLIHHASALQFYYGGTVDDNNWANKFEIPTDGNIWMAWANANISTLLDAKQNASTAITTSNIGSQSVNYATSAGSAGSATTSGTTTHYQSRTDGTWYNTVWAAGNPSHLYSADSVQIRSSDGAFRANIYYDSQDTGYYLDPNSVSKLWSVQPLNLSGATLNVRSTDAGVNGSGNYEQATFIDNTIVTAHVSTGNGNSGNCYNWYSTEWINVNPEKDYEFTVWVKSDGNDNIYFGWHELNAAGSQITSNPYFHGGKRNTGTTWIKLTARLKGWRTPASAGDTEGADRWANNSSYLNDVIGTSDGVMHSSTRAIHMRFGTCYGSVNGSKTYFYAPRIREITYDEIQNNFTIPYYNGSSWGGKLRFGYNDWGYYGIGMYGAAGEFRMSSDSGDLNLRVDGWIQGHNYVQSHSAMYSPIYYDGNDSSYYLDPNSGSRLSTMQIDRIGVGQAVDNGYRIITSGDIYLNAIGNGWAEGVWKQRRGGSTFYDVIDAGNIASQSVSYADESGYSASSGSVEWTSVQNKPSLMPLSGIPSGSDQYVNLRVIGNFNAGSGSGMHVGYGNQNSGNTMLYGGGGTSPQMYIYGDHVYSPSSFRAPIFYDSNDTNYYLDPNGTSNLSRLLVPNASAGASLIVGNNNTSRVLDDNARKGLVVNADYYPHIYVNALSSASNDVHGAVISMTGVLSAGGYRRWGMGIANTDPSALSWGWWDNESNPHYSVGGTLGYTNTGSRMWLDTGGNLQTTGSMRAPIFYDSNDTSYYLDPNADLSLKVYGEICNSNYQPGRLQPGALNIGRTDTNYAWDGTTWADDVRLGLLANTNETWEFGIHDSGDSVMSVVHFDGGSTLTMGRNLGWGQCVVNAPAGYVSNGNAWGTANSAFFPNGITTAGGTNWIYGFTYIGNAPSNGNGHEFNANGTQYSTASITTPTFIVNNHSDNTRGYRIHNTSGSSVSAMFVNSANALVIAAGAVDQINLNKKVLVNGVALGVNVAPSGTAGRIDASNDIVAYSSSDERLKHNITPIENALDKVKSLTGVEFDWKPEYKQAHGYEGHDTGIIAQQVQDVMPSAVRTNETGFLAVRYEKLIGLLVEANKELAARVEELEKKLG